MRNRTNVIGRRFGNLVVVASVGVNKHRQQVLKCKRDEGGHKTINLSNLYRSDHVRLRQSSEG